MTSSAPGFHQARAAHDPRTQCDPYFANDGEARYCAIPHFSPEGVPESILFLAYDEEDRQARMNRQLFVLPISFWLFVLSPRGRIRLLRALDLSSSAWTQLRPLSWNKREAL